ncbi:hypothetical protein B0H21DRAFT_682788, partial [Amylocystis lapponica]
TMRRNCIKPELMEALQMLKFSVKAGRGLDFTAGTSKKAEVMRMELAATDQTLIPEDKTAFIAHLMS